MAVCVVVGEAVVVVVEMNVTRKKKKSPRARYYAMACVYDATIYMTKRYVDIMIVVCSTTVRAPAYVSFSHGCANTTNAVRRMGHRSIRKHSRRTYTYHLSSSPPLDAHTCVCVFKTRECGALWVVRGGTGVCAGG